MTTILSLFFWERSRRTPDQDNEQKVLCAVRYLIERLQGAKAEQVSRPDTMERQRPAVDEEFAVNSISYSVEHTRIQAFDNEFKADATWRDYLEDSIRHLEDDLECHLPPDSDFELWVPADLRIGRKNFNEFYNKLKIWIKEVGPLLGFTFANNIIVRKFTAGQYIISVRLGRYPLGFCKHRSAKRFHVERMLATNESKDREMAIRAAFEKKAGKLFKRKRDGSFAILALEWVSPIATPEIPIYYAGRMLSESFSHAVDRVVVVSTTDNIWSLQYSDPGQAFVGTTANWWLYNPVEKVIWQRD